MKNQYAIIVAAGIGDRMKTKTPKQFLPINGKPMLMHSITAFYNYLKEIEIILVLPEDKIDYWQTLCKKHRFSIKHKTIIGGRNRFYSVRNGLENLETQGYVAIHDGARPIITRELIKSCFTAAIEKGNALPVVEINDSVRLVCEDGNEPIERSRLRICQTPQVFMCSEIKKAYEQPCEAHFTDDASVLESAGYKINMIEGQLHNIKITTTIDLILAETFLNQLNQISGD